MKMIFLPRREVTIGDFPDMNRDELDIEWRKAKVSFDQALAQKTETDSIYIAAANRLNTFDRVVKKVEQRAAANRREAAKSLLRTEQVGLRV
jgi:hypothetical protein